MQSIYQYAWIVPMCPCLAATILGLCLLSARTATRSQRMACAVISIGMLAITMIFSVLIFWEQITSGVDFELQNDSAHRELWSWIVVGSGSATLSLKIGYLIDPLSSIMLVLVTTVGVAVMVYTDGYMSHDQGYVRFFAYLSLFTASMLGLVLSPNLIQVYVFWELVGMCSYLLVGFWFTRASAAYACQKAFVTNRVGDFGLLLGILGFYWLTDSFDFDIIAQRTHNILADDPTKIDAIRVCCILLFLGPIAKSAQFPLHVWLPDAMEGPTPISALIHAATMVAAGVFLTARLLVLFQEVPFVMDTIAWTGGITALLGATLALAQKDLKRGLAYSTMSQLGYMILALGIGSYKAGLFHLVTHAYSKALLFLGSGSVIHGMEPVVGYNPNKSQDMSYMGGIRSYMPITGTTFLIGTLSLCGIPPFACFWSKDEILADAWAKLPVIGWIAWLTAGLTAFYMFRMYFLTFEGDFRGSAVKTSTLGSISASHNNQIVPHGEEIDGLLYEAIADTTGNDNGMPLPHPVFPHESSLAMVLPLVVLTIPTGLIGLIGAPLPSAQPGSGLLSSWLHLDYSLADPEGWTEFALKALPSVSIGIFGAFIAWTVYGPHVTRLKSATGLIDPIPAGWVGVLLNGIYNWSLNRGYIDKLYEKTFVFITRTLARVLSLFDQWAIDGAVNLSGLLTFLGGESTRYGEGGRTTSYIFVLTAALFVLMTIIPLFGTLRA